MKNLVILLLLAGTTIASAQPILTASTSNPVIGEQFLNFRCHTAGVPVGTGGAGVVWNYSALVDSANDTTAYVTCASTPYCDSLVPCTMANISNFHNNYRGIYCDTFEFNWVNAAFTDFYGGFHLYYQYFDRPYHLLKYPMTYGDNWHDTCIYRIPINNQISVVSQYHTVDGYGTLITPAGTFTNVLRVHATNYYADSTSGSLLGWGRTENYYWFTPGYHDPLLTINVYIDSASHVVTTQDAIFSASAPLAVTNPATEQTQINVYPNPANGILNFTSELKNCTATLTDVTGRTVATARERSADGSGQIDVSGLSGCMYLLQLKNDATVQTRKVIVGKSH